MSTQFEKDQRLFRAAQKGNLDAGRKALKQGANPNFVEPLDRGESSTLLRAVAYGHTAFTEMLLDAGASVPPSKDQQQHLSFAARSADCPATLLLLIRHGLPPNRDDGDWAQERGYREVQELVEQSLGPFTITYVIDELLTKPYNKFYYEFGLGVPQYYSIHDPMLYPEERVIRDLWEFCCDTGSGFTSLVGNQHYDTVERAYGALREIRPSNGLRAVSDLREVLHKHGFPLEPDKALAHLSTLSKGAGQAMENDIAALDHRFFGDGEEESLWRHNDYLEYGMQYAHEHVGIFRKRAGGAWPALPDRER